MSPLAERKIMSRLDGHSRRFIELSPFIVIATTDTDGHADASPRGDPPGFVRVIDDVSLLIPDRPGNNRVDTFANLLTMPGIGLIFFVPGIDETLRINGTAELTTDPKTLAASEVAGKQPITGLTIAIREVFFHCGKALKRAKLWDPAAQIERHTFPSLGRVIADQIGGISPTEADERIDRSYRDKLY